MSNATRYRPFQPSRGPVVVAVVSLVLAASAVAVAVFYPRGRAEPVTTPPAPASVVPKSAEVKPVATPPKPIQPQPKPSHESDGWTERELAAHLKRLGVKVEYGGGGILFDPAYETAAYAKVTGYVSFDRYPTEDAARRASGATRFGFHWHSWVFVPHIFEANYQGHLLNNIKSALGVPPSADDKQAAADETRIYQLVAMIAAELPSVESGSQLPEAAYAALVEKLKPLLIEHEAICKRHPGWLSSGPKPTKAIQEAT